MTIVIALLGGLFTVSASLGAAYFTFHLQNQKKNNSIERVLNAFRKIILFCSKYREILQTDRVTLVKIRATEKLKSSNIIYGKTLLDLPTKFDFSYLHVKEFLTTSVQQDFIKKLMSSKQIIENDSPDSQEPHLKKHKCLYSTLVCENEKEVVYILFSSNESLVSYSVKANLSGDVIAAYLDQVSQAILEILTDYPELRA